MDYHQHSTQGEWPPKNIPDDQYGHLVVGTNLFPTLNDVIRSIKATEGVEGYCQERMIPSNMINHRGYVVHLPPGNHTMSESHSSDLPFLRLMGDVQQVKGVGYFHQVGLWEDYNHIHNEYDVCEGGEAPFCLSVNCDQIHVDSCTSPDFSSVRCGDELTFFHRDGKMTHHHVVKGCKRKLYLDHPVPLKGKCVVKGEGFWIHPNVTVDFCSRHCKSQKLLVEHRLEFLGLRIHTSNPVFVGTTGGHSEVSHSTVEGKCGGLIHEGKADWSRPNVWTNKLTFNDASNGFTYLQSFVGCNAGLIAHSNAQTKFHYGIFLGNRVGVDLHNHGKVALFSSFFCSCDTGLSARHNSEASIPKTRFLQCELAVTVLHNSHVSAFPLYVDYNIVDAQAVILLNNGIAFHTQHDSHVNLKNVYTNQPETTTSTNDLDLIHDDVPDASTADNDNKFSTLNDFDTNDFTEGAQGDGQSLFFYEDHNPKNTCGSDLTKNFC